jgi:small subunit ribosomal protein S6e
VLLFFNCRRVAAEVEGDVLGEEFKGYVFKIMGGQDKQVRAVLF